MRQAARPPGCARCGAGAGSSAMKYQSLGTTTEGIINCGRIFHDLLLYGLLLLLLLLMRLASGLVFRV